MVCYARPASLLAAIVVVAWVVFAGPVSHFFSTAAVLAAVLTATAGRGRGRGARVRRLHVHPPPPGRGRRLRELPVPLPARHDRG